MSISAQLGNRAAWPGPNGSQMPSPIDITSLGASALTLVWYVRVPFEYVLANVTSVFRVGELCRAVAHVGCEVNVRNVAAVDRTGSQQLRICTPGNIL